MINLNCLSSLFDCFYDSFPRETGSPSRLKNTLLEHVFCSPKELLKLSVPSVVYAVQNNMAFLALSNLDAAVYQVRREFQLLLECMSMCSKSSGWTWLIGEHVTSVMHNK